MTDDPIPWTLAEPEAMVIVRRIKARRHRHLFVPRLSEDGERWHAAWTVDAEGEAVPPPLEMPPPTWVSFCACGAEYNPAASRRGKSARNRGNAFEREVAAALGVRRVGQYGSPTDVEGEWIAVQCKVGAAFPERLWGWLPAARGDQLRAVVIGDAPGSSGKRRVLIALDFDEFCAWFGKR